MKPGKKRPTPAEFAEAAPVGTRVRYYSVLPADEDAFVDSFIRSGPWEMGGRTVVMIDGKSGGVDVGHLVLYDPAKHVRGVAGVIHSSRQNQEQKP